MKGVICKYVYTCLLTFATVTVFCLCKIGKHFIQLVEAVMNWLYVSMANKISHCLRLHFARDCISCLCFCLRSCLRCTVLVGMQFLQFLHYTCVDVLRHLCVACACAREFVGLFCVVVCLPLMCLSIFPCIELFGLMLKHAFHLVEVPC